MGPWKNYKPNESWDTSSNSRKSDLCLGYYKLRLHYVVKVGGGHIKNIMDW